MWAGHQYHRNVQQDPRVQQKDSNGKSYMKIVQSSGFEIKIYQAEGPVIQLQLFDDSLNVTISLQWHVYHVH